MGHQYTVDEIGEVGHCAIDPAYFISKYCKVQGYFGLGDLELTPAQTSALGDFKLHQKNIVRHPRFAGVSTIEAGFALWQAMFHWNKNVFIATESSNQAVRMMKVISEMLYNLPHWLQPGITSNSCYSGIKFSTGSLIRGVTPSSSSSLNGMRGNTIALLIWMDASLLPLRTQDEFWQYISPHISSCSKVIISANETGRDGDLFSSLCWNANTNGFNLIDFTPEDVLGYLPPQSPIAPVMEEEEDEEEYFDEAYEDFFDPNAADEDRPRAWFTRDEVNFSLYLTY